MRLNNLQPKKAVSTVLFVLLLSAVGMTNALYDCRKFTGNLVIPNSVTTISNNAFISGS